MLLCDESSRARKQVRAQACRCARRAHDLKCGWSRSTEVISCLVRCAARARAHTHTHTRMRAHTHTHTHLTVALTRAHTHTHRRCAAGRTGGAHGGGGTPHTVDVLHRGVCVPETMCCRATTWHSSGGRLARRASRARTQLSRTVRRHHRVWGMPLGCAARRCREKRV